jgi:hypothetical protein
LGKLSKTEEGESGKVGKWESGKVGKWERREIESLVLEGGPNNLN